MQIGEHGAGEGCVMGAMVTTGGATGNMGCTWANFLGCQSGRKVLEVQEESLPSMLCMSGGTEAVQGIPVRDRDGWMGYLGAGLGGAGLGVGQGCWLWLEQLIRWQDCSSTWEGRIRASL